MQTFTCGDKTIAYRPLDILSREEWLKIGCGREMNTEYQKDAFECPPINLNIPGPWNDYQGEDKFEHMNDEDWAGRAETEVRLCHDCYPLSWKNVSKDNHFISQMNQFWEAAEELAGVLGISHNEAMGMLMDGISMEMDLKRRGFIL